MVMAYAKVINEMWKGCSSYVSPDLFKKILGQYNPVFEGYGQHDSQECINSVLDLMSEDLFKNGKKPYVEISEKDGKSDEQASLEAWNKHVYRHQSVILDLFHGQYKTKITCSLCNRISITFDPYLIVNLPIPVVKMVDLEVQFVPYDEAKEACKFFKISGVKDTDKLYEFRSLIQQKYGYDKSSFIIAKMAHNKMDEIFHTRQSVKDLKESVKYGGQILLIEIPKKLAPSLPPMTQIKNDDSNYGVKKEWVKVVVHMTQDDESFGYPRVFWAKKSWSTKTLHVEFYKQFQSVFAKWFKKVQSLNHYKKKYTNKQDKPYEVEFFEKLNVQQQFDLFFNTLSEDNYKTVLGKRRWEYTEMPYKLMLENNSSFSEDCFFCGSISSHELCPAPFKGALSLKDMLNKIGVEDNTSFFQQDNGKNDLILNCVLHTQFQQQDLFKELEAPPRTSMAEYNAGKYSHLQEESSVSIYDCLNEMSNQEILDEDNMWYCNKCKTHVQASMQMELFKAPPILVLNLKRFKQGRQSSYFSGLMGGYGGGRNQKLEQLVDFPVEGLDLSSYVKGKHDKPLIYDCYAVSNHFGTSGFGHYTAYCKNPMDKQWYEFDDSKVVKI